MLRRGNREPGWKGGFILTSSNIESIEEINGNDCYVNDRIVLMNGLFGSFLN